MKKMFRFLLALFITFFCMEIGVKAATYSDVKNVGGSTVFAAYATRNTGYWAGSIQVSGGTINVKGAIYKNGSKKASCNRLMDSNSPLQKSGSSNANSVKSEGTSASYTVSVENPK